jgi:Kef-type K+ transport system membrane component KefB
MSLRWILFTGALVLAAVSASAQAQTSDDFDAAVVDAGTLPLDATAVPHADPLPHADPGAASPIEDPEATAAVAIRTILALLGLLTLAYLGGHPRVQKLEELLGVSQVVTAGFPFFALGAIAHLPQVGLLPDSVLSELRPLLEMGLGWIGLLAGLQFELRAAEERPKGTANLTGVLTFVPFIFIAGALGVVLYALAIPVSTSRLLRDAAMIGAAGCLAAPTAAGLLATTGLSLRAAHVVRSVAIVDDVVGVALLALLSAFYRPDVARVSWDLPGIGWLFLELGIAVSMGMLMYAVLRTAKSTAELTALLLGSIALAAGSATVFSVSPIVICFVAGFMLANLPGRHHEAMRAPLERLERPIYFMFLLFAGALWRFDYWQGWALLPVFVAARLVGRGVAARIARGRGLMHQTPGEEMAVSRAFVAAPIGALSIAMVVNVQTLYPGRAVPLMITVVVGGALASEVLVQLSSRLFRSRQRSTSERPPTSGREERP